MQSPLPGLGLNTWSQNVVYGNTSNANLLSLYNNGFTRSSFRVKSTLPGTQSMSNFQARGFQNYAYIPVLQHLGQSGVLALPASFRHANPAGVPPTMSQLTNWGGNPAIAPQHPFIMPPSEQPFIYY